MANRECLRVDRAVQLLRQIRATKDFISVECHTTTPDPGSEVCLWQRAQLDAAVPVRLGAIRTCIDFESGALARDGSPNRDSTMRSAVT